MAKSIDWSGERIVMGIVDFPTDKDDESRKKKEIVKRLSNTELDLSNIDLEIKERGGYTLPLDQIPALGVAFASMPEVFRTTVGTVSTPALLTVTDASGVELDPSILQKFHDGTGMMGSFRDLEKGFSQARFHLADPGSITTTATSAINPTMLFMAVALSQITKKLDTIQETQDEMFEYMVQKDRAALRGNTKTLTDILNGYKFNWQNETWRNNAHMKTVDIKQESEKDIIHLREQIAKKLNKKGPVEVRLAVGKRMDEVLDRLKEYQIAVYNHAFASFLEPMLSENYDAAYLENVSEKISEYSIEYRELYTECYDAIEDSTKGAVDTMLLGGLSFAGKKLGKAIAATPVGEKTMIDEALEGASEGIGSFNENISGDLMKELQQAKTPNTMPFKESIESISELYNSPMTLLADADTIYLFPGNSAA